VAQSIYLIPLAGIPETFLIDLAGVTYTLTVYWNDSDEGGWVLDIADSSQNSIVAGIPMITGCSLLDGLEYLGINGELWVFTDGDSNAVPTFDNLGNGCNLYFTTDAANAS
jgi:uncharacterized protein DUF6983